MNALTHAGILNMAMNALMIAAIAGLWLMWARASRRQCEVESLLRATSEQLDTALIHMEQAMDHIRRLEASRTCMTPAPDGKPSQKARDARGDKKSASASDESESPRMAMEHVERASRADAAGAAPLTRVLRLHREGYKAEDIAVRENIPLAKVRLMLKLHDRRAAA
jgi:hypothetical protein